MNFNEVTMYVWFRGEKENVTYVIREDERGLTRKTLIEALAEKTQWLVFKDINLTWVFLNFDRIDSVKVID